ncbi:hypothetical protein Tco_0883641 [Tanacetum coccineum]
MIFGGVTTTQAQQKALDDALVALADRLDFGKCNMRLKIDIKPKEATFQVVLDALALTPFYCAFLITADVPAIYMQAFWATVSVHRAFSTVINKSLSGKKTGMDKIRLSRAQILWGMLHKNNNDYVYLLWEDLLFQIENKDAKKTNKMSYPRFTKIIINHFMSKDQSISRRNKMFWHIARDDTMFTSMRCISRHEVTQSKQVKRHAKKPAACVAIKDTPGESVPKKKTPTKGDKGKGLTVLSEEALSEAAHLKEATKQSKTDFHISHAGGFGTNEGTEDDDDVEESDDQDDNDDDAKIDDDDMNNDEETDSERTESDRDEILDPNLTNVEQTEHEKAEYSDQRVYTPPYYQLTEEEMIDDKEKMDKEAEDEVTKELYTDMNVNLGTEDAEMTNVDAEITNADQGGKEQQNVSQDSGFHQEEEDAHVTLTVVHNTQKIASTKQSSSVSSEFTSKLLNLDNPSPNGIEIASLMDTSIVPPLPPLVNHSPHLTTITQQQTPDSTITTANSSMTLP